jgi:hypothetical protein
MAEKETQERIDRIVNDADNILRLYDYAESLYSY